MEMGSGESDIDKHKVRHDPGWNDPPTFAYNATAGQSAKKGTLLNKRVAFPLGAKPPGNVATPSPGQAPMLPSFLPGPPSIPPVSIGVRIGNTKTVSDAEESLMIDKEEALSQIMTTFNGIMNEAMEHHKKTGDEIKKRLEVLTKMWEEDKLKPDVHKKLLQLSDALQCGNSELADLIQVGLMVDHVAQCSPWMAGIRHLIHHVKTTSNTEATDEGVNTMT